jgi:hypothetical protein
LVNSAAADLLEMANICRGWGLGSAGIACSSLFALDPRQPLAQLYHSSWNSRNGLIGSVTALAQTTDGYPRPTDR